jgi:hypothetical protein
MKHGSSLPSGNKAQVNTQPVKMLGQAERNESEQMVTPADLPSPLEAGIGQLNNFLKQLKPYLTNKGNQRTRGLSELSLSNR